KNFRSIGERGLELKFSNKLTTFIGENNVGKSSIFKAISRSLEPGLGWDSEEWYAGDDNKIAEIHLLCTLDNEQITKLINILNLPFTVSDFKENFTDKFEYKHSRSKTHHSTTFKFGDLNLENRRGWIGNEDNKGYSIISIRDIIYTLKTQNSKNFLQIFEDKINEYQKVHNTNLRIEFEKDISENLLELLQKNLIIIEEFRQRPDKTVSDFLTSPKGQELASVLFNLKNARPYQRRKYEQIQHHFHEFFPMLSLDVINENSEIKILVQKEGIESTHLYLGAGIIEVLLLITHLIAHKEKVIFIDHPESHLHPHAQRRLSTMFEDANNSQICIITHSPYFVNLNRNSNILRFVQDSAQTKCIELPPDYFT
ncbi:MAG: AAA family ATPase, partial [Spirochaetes bacterium]|nr:AAA family ATPase [Spirochaetota bacterium]